MTSRELGWLAGFLEGEGSFIWMKKGGPCIALVNTDRDVVERAAAMLDRPATNDTVWRQKQNPKHKPAWKVRVYGRHAISWMMTLYPLMGDRRRAQIRSVLSAWRASPRLSHGRRGQRTPALCHPTRPVVSRGLCGMCHQRRTLKIAPEAYRRA